MLFSKETFKLRTYKVAVGPNCRDRMREGWFGRGVLNRECREEAIVVFGTTAVETI